MIYYYYFSVTYWYDLACDRWRKPGEGRVAGIIRYCVAWLLLWDKVSKYFIVFSMHNSRGSLVQLTRAWNMRLSGINQLRMFSGMLFWKKVFFWKEETVWDCSERQFLLERSRSYGRNILWGDRCRIMVINRVSRLLVLNLLALFWLLFILLIVSELIYRFCDNHFCEILKFYI